MESSRKVGSAFFMTVCLFFFLSMTGIAGQFGMLGSILFSQMAILIPVIFCIVWRGEKTAVQLGLKKMRITDILVVILYYVCVHFVLAFASTLSLLYSENVTSEKMVELAGSVPVVIGILVMAVLPAMAEEFMFRGLLYTEFRKTSPIWAWVLCSALFGLLHGNLNQFTYSVLAGFLFVIIVEATGSLVSSFIIHCAVNLRSTLTVYAIHGMLEKGGDSAKAAKELLNTTLTKEEILEQLSGTAVNALCGLIAGFLLIRFLAKRNNRLENIKRMFRAEKKENSMLLLREGIFTTPFIVGVALAVTYMVLTELAVRGYFG